MDIAMNRRTFVGGAVAAGVAAATVKAAPLAQADENVVDADIAIVGGGMSGLVCALQAAQEGAHVVMLEKNATCGGNGLVVECVFARDSSLQREKGIEFPLSKVLVDEQVMTRYLGDSTAWKQLDKNSGANIDWLLEQGVAFSDVDDYHGFSHVACAHEFEGGGAQAMATLEQAARDNGVEILTETPVKELVIADDGTVCGAVAKDAAGNTVRVNTKAVVLATGGFQGNPQMMAERGYPADNCWDEGLPGHDGDGLRMAIEAGGMDVSMKRSHVSAQAFRDFSVPGLFGLAHRGDYLWVNQDGERFANEDCTMECPVFPANAVFSQPRCYSLFDSAFLDRHEKRAEFVEAFGEGAENERFMADTIEELAEKAGIDPAALRATVDHYNECCANGFDDEYEKDPEILQPVEEGPFYLIHKIVRFMATIGGIRTNKNTQVVDYNNVPVEGLYAIGVDGCELYVTAYTLGPAGSSDANNVNSGRIAAQHAVATYVK